MTTFSVVIPVDQGADTIVRTVSSALAQTQPAREVILCDVQATDALGEALAHLADKLVIIHGIRPNRVRDALQTGRQPLVVRVQQDHPVARGRPGCRVPGSAQALIRLLTEEKRALAVAEGVQALRAGDRRACLRAACSRWTPVRFRTRFAPAAIAPGLTRRVLDRP